MMLEPNHLGLTIHESVGHPLELDRVLGYEANYAGTSFATLDKWKAGDFNYGSKIVNLVADKTQVGSLGAVGFDDEGVKANLKLPGTKLNVGESPEEGLARLLANELKLFVDVLNISGNHEESFCVI